MFGSRVYFDKREGNKAEICGVGIDNAMINVCLFLNFRNFLLIK
jgi:hypothetical protein